MDSFVKNKSPPFQARKQFAQYLKAKVKSAKEVERRNYLINSILTARQVTPYKMPHSNSQTTCPMEKVRGLQVPTITVVTGTRVI